MIKLNTLVREGQKYAIYAHKEDISSVINFIKTNTNKRYRIDSKTYLATYNKKRTLTGAFVVVNEKKIKFSDKPLNISKDYPLFVWNKRGGDNYA